MDINLEAAELHTIQAYSDNQIQINSKVYKSSLIISKEKIISDLKITNIAEIDASYTDLLIQLKPEVILIGHKHTGKLLPMSIRNLLSKQRIGVECMSVGAACRTYNVLLHEYRAVVAGVII